MTSPVTSTTESPESPSRASRAASSGIAAAAMLIMLGNLLSRVLGLVREQLASGLFGTGNEIAAFQIADNVQTLLFDLAVSGMLEAALVPVLVQWAAPDLLSRAELRRVSGALLTLVIGVVGSAVVLGMVFAPTLVRLMTSLGGGGSEHSAETTRLTVQLVRIILPAVFFLVVGTLFMSVLYALKQVSAPALAVTARNAAVVVAMVLFSGRWGVKSMAGGVVVGGVLIMAMNAVPLWRAGALPRPNLGFRHPGVKTVLRLQFPIFLGLIVSAIAVIVDRNLAWHAEEDALGAMRYATTLVQFLLGMVAAAISLASLPTLSDHHTRGDAAAFRRTLERALAMVTVLILPAVLGLAALSRPVVSLLFEHGATDGHDARRIVTALLFYLPGTLFAAYDQVLIYAFYARRNTWRPVLVGVAATSVYFVVAIPLGRSIGMVGLVLANSAQFLAHAVIMAVLIRRTVGGEWGTLRRTIGRTAVAAGLTAAAALGVWLAVDRVLPGGGSVVARTAAELIAVGVPAAAGALVYAVAMHRLRVEEAAELRRTVLGRVHPVLGR